MHTDVTPRHRAWQQARRLGAAAVLGVPAWLLTGVLLPPGEATESPSWFAIGDPVVALGCLVALVWRRRYPLTVATTVAIASAASTLAAGAGLLAVSSISTRRRPMEIGVVLLAYLTASQTSIEIYPVPGSAAATALRLAFPTLIAGMAVAAGLTVGARRVEVRTLHERAQSAEREQTARAAQARTLERNRIAREMHDVLAHRISLVAMQAGVLNHRKDLPTHENQTLLNGIAEGSHQALEELRDVLGVLRAEPHHPELAQPSLHRIPDMVADARTSGLDITLTTTVTGTPPDTISRTAYRVVQEGLTNAAKHAPGAPIHITLRGTPGDTLDVHVSNDPPTTSSTTRTTPPPTSGFGLLGLAERVNLTGGKLTPHPTPGSGYLLTAQLPWSTPTHEMRP
jgi:signal transduction histidine kinase